MVRGALSSRTTSASAEFDLVTFGASSLYNVVARGPCPLSHAKWSVLRFNCSVTVFCVRLEMERLRFVSSFIYASESMPTASVRAYCTVQ